MAYHMRRYEVWASSPPITFGERSGLSKNVLARIFRAQLRTSLLVALRPVAANMKYLGIASASLDGQPLETFGDLLQHASPPLPLLRLAKDFAKCADKATIDRLPTEIAAALYFLVIAAAILRHGSLITTLQAIDLEEGLRWTARLPWLDTLIRQLAARALSSIESQ
jgi:hypothetical protein